MAIDLGIAAVVLIFGLFGLVTGAAAQLAHWAGLLAGTIGGPLLAGKLLPFINARGIGLSPATAKVILSALFFSAIYIAAAWLLKSIFAKLLAHKATGWLDRAGGLVLGAGKAALVLFAAASLGLYFEKDLLALAKPLGGPPKELQGSKILEFVRRHNLFAKIKLPELDALEKLMAAAKDPGSAKAILQDPGVRKLLEDPSLMNLLKDEKMSQALASGDFKALEDSGLMKALKDPKLAKDFQKMVDELKAGAPKPER